MELVQEARELVCWAAEEMEAPEAARAQESTLRRLCLGQGADIWAYILRHVHSQRNVKKIRGNLLWYGHQYSPEACRKSELEAAVARLQAEIQELDQSLELMDQETEAQDMAMEQALQNMQDTQRRALLLRAQAGVMRRQQRDLQNPMQWLQNQLRHLQDTERKAKVDVTFGPLTSAALGLEPVVLGDVRTVCTLRTQFLKNLLIPQAKGGSVPTPQDDNFGTSYHQWLSSVETLLTNHPPGHILAALEHLAAERQAEVQSLCSSDGLQDTETARSQVPDQSDCSQALPSMVHLIQEGWQTVGALVTQRGPLLKEHQVLTQRLQSLMEEMESCTLGSSERQALVLGLRGCGLWAELKALNAQSQELEEAAGQRQLLLQELQAKQQRILHWRQLVEETQEQVRLLIKGNSASKTRLCRSPGEVLALVQRKVVPTSEAVAPQSQELLRCLEEGARHLPHLPLSTLLRHNPGELQPLPMVLPSIHQLHPTSSRGPSLIALSHILGLPTGKAPELLLPKAASLRQDLLFLQDQRSLRCADLLHMKTSLPPGPLTQGAKARNLESSLIPPRAPQPSTCEQALWVPFQSFQSTSCPLAFGSDSDLITEVAKERASVLPKVIRQELLQIWASQEKEQKENLGQALKQLENLLKQALERIPELQGIVGDWWEQPGQVALSGELCHGLPLPQWRLRWVQAQGTLQQLCR